MTDQRTGGLLGCLLGTVRLAVAAGVVVVGTVIVLLVGWVPVRVRGARMGGWIVTGMARTVWTLFGARVRCPEAERLRAHHGFLFPNHRSWADIIVLLHVFPVRFLSNHTVERMPFIGRLARAMGTVFVNRESSDSRASARRELAGALDAQPHPPLVLFPEGGINREPGLQPLRRGAFEVAADGGFPYLLCAIRYSDEAAVRWGHGEPILRAVWRLVRHRGILTAHVDVLDIVHPDPEDAADALAEHAEAVLGTAITGVAADR